MNKFQQLDDLILETFASFDENEIIEVISFEQLLEISGSGGGQGYAAPFGDVEDIKKFNKIFKRTRTAA